MRNIYRIYRSLTRLTRRGHVLPVHGTGEAAMLAATQHKPPGWSRYPPLLALARTMLTHGLLGGARWPVPPGRQRTMTEPGLLPRTLQLCIHCQDNPASFWVTPGNGKVARRPWCLSCCQELDRDRCDVTPIGG
jgi:hypothetical protein